MPTADDTGNDVWWDLATGWTVRVWRARLPDDWRAREIELDDAIAGCGGSVIDGGRIGLDGWFEAHAIDGRRRPRPDRQTMAIVGDVCARAASFEGHGVHLVPVPIRREVDSRTFADALARPLRALGFVVMNPSLALPLQATRHLVHRHTCLVVAAGDERTLRWVRDLGASTRRGHLVVDLRPPRTRARPAATTSRFVTAPSRTDPARRARHLMMLGDLAGADGVIATALAEDALRGGTARQSVAAAAAEVRFWQGRVEEGRTLAHDIRAPVEGPVLRGLLGWAARDRAAVVAAARALNAHRARDQTHDVRTWRRTFALLSAACDGDGRRARAVVGRLAGARGPRTFGTRLALLAAAAAACDMGHRRWAGRIAGRRSAWLDAAPLECLAFDWITVDHDDASRSPLLDRIRRTGALGLCGWGMRRDTMLLAHALPALLQVLHDAENDLAALRAGAEWLCRECAASGAAFFDADTPTMVVAAGWTTADTVLMRASGVETRWAGPGGTVFVATPVRYAGVSIGRLVARGAVERQETLTEAVRLLAAVSGAACRSRLDVLLAARRCHAAMPEILGRSPSIAALRETIAQAAATPFPVLVEGESGTGKELVARAIHRLSARRDRKFCAVNCAAISDELVEAELFGHARGAFTGAVGLRTGLFEEAHGGTLFLDEVSELSPRAQAKILRALQEREVRRVGENAARPVDVRVIAATNRPLAEMVARAGFREDLLFRLAVVRIRLPPLRDRIEDIPLLADACWRSLMQQARKRAVLGADALAALCRHRWPGNVREFQNVTAALAVVAPVCGRVGGRHVQHVLSVNAAGAADDEEVVPLQQLRMTCERRAVAGALAHYSGRRAEAARALGLSRQGLTKAIRRLGLDRPRDVAGVA